MKLKIKTETFKEMVSKSVKGASCNKLIPITGFMAVYVKSGTLFLVTTDATNYLYIKKEGIESDDFYVVVEVEVFSKLISRMTCEFVTLEVTDNVLKVVGNGTYNIEVVIEEDGEMVRFPDPLDGIKASPIGEMQVTSIGTILNTLKPSLATTLEVPCYTGYYFGENVVATDTEIMSVLNSRVLPNEYLISSEMVDLLSIMTAEKIGVDGKDNILIFTSPDCIVYGPTMEGIEEYPVDKIQERVSQEFPRKCTISKDSLLQLLDRLVLFVGPYDDRAVDFVFTKEGLLIQSKSTSGSELIPYMESENFQEFSGIIDIVYLRTQIKSQTSDKVEMYYGDPNLIKTVDGNITQCIALIQK